MKKKVLSRHNFPSGIPVFKIATTYLLLDKFQAAAWIWGAVGCGWFVLVCVAIHAMHDDEEIDIEDMINGKKA